MIWSVFLRKIKFGTAFAFSSAQPSVFLETGGSKHTTTRSTLTTMTSRYLMKMRALAAAAIAFAAFPMITPAYGQDAAAPPPTEATAVVATPVTETPAEEKAAPAYATYEEFKASPEYVGFLANNLWIMIAASLVFLMHLGFATVESGMCQQKNTVNILFKNVFIVCIGALGYMFYGFNAMYPGWEMNVSTDFFALGKPITNSFDDAGQVANMTTAYATGPMTYWTDFFYQAMFAATAATIVSGAVAERVKLSSFMIYATILVTFLYPITGSWKWGYGWLNTAGFHDFAGSTLVHAFGGFAALAAVIVLGPRLGKYTKDGVKPILPHNLPLSTIGVFLLFLGWFGFNGGSVLSADPQSVSRVFVTTAVAGFAGGIGAMLTSWIVLKKPDLSMMLNGMLAGLVGITAGADDVTPFAAVAIGAIAGIIVVFSVLFFDKVKIDDPVGAISVHGVCGIFGTLAPGIFGTKSLGVQLMGTLSVSAFAFITSFALFYIIKLIMGVRVDAQEEHEGLDVAEHGAPAYNDSQA
jgi:Amt family ammonium transporter